MNNHPTYTQKQGQLMFDLLLEIIGSLGSSKAKAKMKREKINVERNYGYCTHADYHNKWRQQAAYKGLQAVIRMKK